MADVNKIGKSALADAPSPISRLLSSIKPTFSSYSGATKGIGPQPSLDSPIAGVVPGSPSNILVTDPTRFLEAPDQTAIHEFIHLIHNNLTPEQQKAIPPDTGNPLVAIDPAYLAKQRKDGKNILQLPREQQAYLAQYYRAHEKAFEKGAIDKKQMDQIEKTYGPWIKDFDRAKLSTIETTDPNSPGNTINTTPRAPMTPIQQSTVQFDAASPSIPVAPKTPADDNKPVDWMKKGHSYAADAGAEKPITSVRPSKQKPTDIQAKPKAIPVNTEDEKKSEDNSSQARDYRQQLIKSRIAEVSNPDHKNPFHFTHPLDQQAATFAKAQRIVSNPNFKALPDDKRAAVLNNYYEKYVAPVYKNAKLEPPHKDAWVSQVQKGFFKVSDFYEYSQATNKDAVADLASTVSHAQASAVQAGFHLGHAIIMAGVWADRKQLGIVNFFPGSALHSYVEGQKEFDDKLAAPALKLSQDAIDRATFWLDTHPSRSFSEKAGSIVGEQAVQLPLYETIAAPLGALGKVVSSSGEIGKSANFTRRLATSKTGQFVGRRLKEAASSYIGDIFSETPQGDRATNMAIFMGLGVGGEVLSSAGKALVKPISRASMKRVAATNIAVGGKIFHETVADQAEFELIHNIVGTDVAGNPILHEAEKFPQQMQAAEQADPVKHGIITAEKISQNAMARQLYDKPLNQLSKLQRRKVRVELAHLASEATEEIPIHVPEVAHHEVQSKLAEDVQSNPELGADFEALEKKYGKKIVDEVVKEEQDSLAVEHGIKSTQGATARIGRNEKVLAEANSKLGGNRPKNTKAPRSKEDQIFHELSDTGNARYYHKDEGFNLTFASKVDKALYRVSAQDQRFSGWSKQRIASHDNSMRKLRQFFPEKSDAEIKELARSVKEQIDGHVKGRLADPTFKNNTHPNPTEIKIAPIHTSAGAAKSETKLVHEDIPKSYVSFRSQTLAHFTNPFKSAAQKSKQSLEKFLDGMDDADFIQEISDQMGNQIKFEKPFDMLLWGLHHSESIPSPIVSKIKRVLHDQDPGMTHEAMKDEARRLSAHIDMLAMSGRLDAEGNVFRSTITTSFTGRTKWQKEAEKEAAIAEIENYKNTMGPYKKNFADQYDAGLKELAKLQMLRRRSATDENFFAAHDKVKKILTEAESAKKPSKRVTRTTQNDEGFESDVTHLREHEDEFESE